MFSKFQFYNSCIAVVVSSFLVSAQDSTSSGKNPSQRDNEIDSAATIIVTATRRAQQSNWISDDHTVLQVEKETRTSSKSVSEMLADRVPAFMSDYGGGASKKVSLRGAGSERTLVLIDGKRIGTNDNDLSDIAVEAIKKVEVVEGGQSALYGMDAVGGVVNLITRKATSDGTAGSFSSMVASYEPNNGRDPGLNTNGNQATISHKAGPFEGFAAGGWNFSDGHYDFNTTESRYRLREGNAFRNLNGFTRLGYDTDGVSLGITGSIGDRIIQNPGSIAWPSPGTTRKNILATAFDGSWKTTGFLTNRFSGSIGRDRIGFIARDASMAQNSSHLHFNESAELVQEFTLKKQLVTTGVEYRRESMLSTDIGTHVIDQTGIFAGAIGTINPGLVMLQATPSIRFDYTNSFNNALNGKIGGIAVAKVPGEPTLFVNVGTASRRPTLNDLYWPRDSFGVGNPEIKPEQSTSADCGFQLRTVSGPAVAQARMTAYRMRMRDMIIWQPDPTDPAGVRWTPSNIAGAVIRGIHGSADFSFGKIFTGTIGAAWNDARDEESNKILIYRPAYVVTFSQNVALDRIAAGMNCRYMSSVFTNDQNTAMLPECTIFDVHTGVNLFSSPDDKRSVALVYEMLNCTNVQHYTNEGYPLPGREHRLSVKTFF